MKITECIKNYSLGCHLSEFPSSWKYKATFYIWVLRIDWQISQFEDRGCPVVSLQTAAGWTCGWGECCLLTSGVLWRHLTSLIPQIGTRVPEMLSNPKSGEAKKANNFIFVWKIIEMMNRLLNSCPFVFCKWTNSTWQAKKLIYCLYPSQRVKNLTNWELL